MVESGAKPRLPAGAQRSHNMLHWVQIGPARHLPLGLHSILSPVFWWLFNKTGLASSKLCSLGPVTLPL